MLSFEDLISKFIKYWSKLGCTFIQPLDLQIGAGTMHPMTFFNGINNKNISIVYIQQCRRPNDSKFNKHNYKYYSHYQLQVLIRPIPNNIKNLYIKSLEYIGISTYYNDLLFVEDNWENKTLSSWGIGWEIRLNNIEITQFTYFQQVGGIKCDKSIIEITYGLERIIMILQNSKNFFNILWNKKNKMYYKDIISLNNIDNSYYNKKCANIKYLILKFDNNEKECIFLLKFKKPLVYVAYEKLLESINIFNILNSRKILSNLEKQSYTIKLQNLSKNIACIYKKKYYI